MDGANMTVGTHGELLANAPLYRDLVGLWDMGQQPMVRDTLAVGNPLVGGTTGRSAL
jgi:hypothetical protein